MQLLKDCKQGKTPNNHKTRATIKMLMIKLTLIATLANAPAMKPVLWTLDGNNLGNRSSIVTDIPANSGTHEVCATLDKTTRCIKFAAELKTEVTLPVAMD